MQVALSPMETRELLAFQRDSFVIPPRPTDVETKQLLDTQLKKAIAYLSPEVSTD